MCFAAYFFDILSFYLCLLVFMTLARRQVTYKGIFFVFSSFLFIFSIYLIFNFSKVIIFGVVSELRWQLSSISWSTLDVSISLRCDTLSFLFVLLVTIIGFGTNLYVLNYLKYEANEDIFSLLINWFMFSMIVLVLANNLFTLFLGWESIGLSSFFLINFWSSRRGTVKSSFKAFFFNKISDLFLFIFLVLANVIFTTNSITLLNIKLTLNLVPSTSLFQLAAVCLFFCTLFKSAQIFGHLWLPDSMEAPVPASALIHSATLVSAGVYLLLRFTPLIVLSNMHLVAIYIGSITAAYGAIVSASQTDMKKLLAYSTISHCGFLFVAIGTQVYVTVIVYLFLHGLFKALTFFCAGSFIRVSGTQDTRQMGALNRILPVDTVFLIVCAFNLGGLPFSLGYLYKSMLLVSILNNNILFLCFGFCVIGLLCGLVYVYRLVYYSAFDISKDFFMQVIYELQQKHINVVKYWSLTTIVQIFAVYFVFSFSCVIYIYFLNYFVYSSIVFDTNPILISGQINTLSDVVTIAKSFYEIFYSAYTLVFLVLVLIVWRIEYTFLFRLNFILNLVIFSFFVSFYTYIFNFI